MQEKQIDIQRYEEDEIDLKELAKTLWRSKIKIVVITSVITILATVYAYMKTPMYEVKSNVQVGFIGYTEGNQNLLDNPVAIVKKLNIIFEVAADDKVASKEKFVSEVSSISQNKKVENYIEIKTSAISNDEALSKNTEVLEYLQKQYQSKIDLYTRNTLNSIEDKKRAITKIDEFEIKNTEYKINVLEKQKLVQIENKINIIKNQDIKKLENRINIIKNQDIHKINKKIDVIKNIEAEKLKKQISLINEQNIVKLNEKINFIRTNNLPTLNKKINFNQEKLIEYNQAINKLFNESKSTSNETVATIASIQMVNYQNLILNTQNKIEDLKISKKNIESETIPSLETKIINLKEITIRDLNLKIKNLQEITIRDLNLKIKNLNEVTIRDIKLKIRNLKHITLVNLKKEKENIKNDTLRKLNYSMKVTLVNKKYKLEQDIKDLNYRMSKVNMQNSSLVGRYIVKDNPIKPKKKLIVVVAFVTGFILSIFLVFFLEFIKGFKKEDFE